MNQQDKPISKKLRVAGLLVIAGLMVEGFSLLWSHPLSFLAFLCVGGGLITLGMVVYLLALVSRTT